MHRGNALSRIAATQTAPLWDNFYTMSFRSFLYSFARVLGDVQAVRKQRVAKRIGRRLAGRAAARAMRGLFK